MLDNLRDQASSSQYYEEAAVPAHREEMHAPKSSLERILGVNAQQRFVLALMLSFVVCLLGVMFLLVMGKIVPPFLY
ncbi:MAG: hypothetical protein Q8N45_09015 [Anaerolineales bacterium]|nr:hypothetical protein [Anaerolineales bacterium]MDO9348508.1 hypothetical protein [Anaerolineales bacterium]MDP2976335.1 hypothetical protein [Anaerolineales bacterium]MDP3186345.1 hypothetical protein [Anaerolineales bacterium]